MSRLFRRVAEENAWHTAAGRPFEIGFSVGLALVDRGDDLDALLERAC